MALISVDVESDGPVPHLYSMVCFGAVVIDPKLDKTFYGETKPISSKWDPEALSISGITREEHLRFPEPYKTMKRLDEWLTGLGGRHTLITDNPAFDWQFINYYFHLYRGKNPFGYSARRIGDLYCGLEKDARKRWKHLRDTKHTHNPVDDAKGNAEVVLKLHDMGIKNLI